MLYNHMICKMTNTYIYIYIYVSEICQTQKLRQDLLIRAAVTAALPAPPKHIYIYIYVYNTI